MSWTRLLAINVIVFLFLLVFIEIGLRFFWTAKQCFGSDSCDFSRLSSFQVRPNGFEDQNVGITQYHEILGYILTPGFNSLITAPGWKNKSVTINQDGFRENDNFISSGAYSILAVGDSFTFGAQVSNNETWPSCLERETGVSVANAGVFGYGAAQSLLRAKLEIQKQSFDTVILSVFLSDDFHRDRLSFRSGFPRPAVVSGANGLDWDQVPSIDSVGTKYNPATQSLVRSLADNSQLFSLIYSRLQSDLDVGNMTRTEVALNAASVEGIMRFTLRQFSNLQVPQKILVIQYAEMEITRQDTPQDFLRLRENLYDEAAKLGIQIIDTSASLSESVRESDIMLWFGHHTPSGNKVVCEVIAQSL